MAMIPSEFIKNIISSFQDLISKNTTKILGLTCETKKLVDNLHKVSHVLQDAERKKMKNSDVNRWLEELKQVIYESEKIIDYCKIEAPKSRRKEQQQVLARPRLLASCFNQSGIGDEILHSIKQLNQKIKIILKERYRLKLDQVVANDAKTVYIHNSSQTLSNDNIVGVNIEDDLNNMVNVLIHGETEEKEENFQLVALVGIGGIGKTTLARKIFDNERIMSSFDTRIWVSLSNGLKGTALLSKIIDALGGKCKKSLTRAKLKSKLGKLITRKRALIVLDDVLDSKILENLLEAPLKNSVNGSRILVTTRDENIPIQMGACYIHNITKLSVENGWGFLCQSAFLEEENRSDILRDIGEKIVEQCDGNPLAIKTIGGVLKRKIPTIKEWLGVSENEAWLIQDLKEGVLNALYLGYEDLPSNLKQCFLYCSLFPKDYAIERQTLIQQWIAEGFIEMRDGYTLEEIGEGYYCELVERYLINPEFGCEDIGKLKMHDLIVSMGRILAIDESFFGDTKKIQDMTFEPCHISFVSKGIEAIPREIKMKERVRTLLLSMNPLRDDELKDSIVKFKQLRVLDLSETLIEKIPDQLRNLLHLRYLNLSRTKIKELPESISHLPFLQFLVLQECKWLHSLPKEIEHLKRLRNIDLSGTTIYQFLFSISKLVSLNSLHFFIVNTKSSGDQDKNGWSLSEMKNLNKLRSLHISQLDKAKDLDEAKEGKLSSKTYLKELELSCTNEVTPLETPIIIQKIEEIFKELCPPQSLETLKIVNYFGAEYPSWLSINSLPNLTHIELINCQFCETLPPLVQLPQLKFLYITNCSNLKDFGNEIIGSEQEPTFLKLEKLHIQNMQKLESWTGLDRPGSLPCLKAFQIESCPEIRYFPSCIRHCKYLNELRVLDCESIESIENLGTIKELSVWNTPKLRKILNLPLLEDLNISQCQNLEIVENVDSLKSVHIFDYDLKEIPKWVGLHASKIYSLNLTGKIEMLTRCLVNGPNWDIIKEINRIYGYSNSRTYFFYQKDPFIYETNLNLPSVPVPLEKEDSSKTRTVESETVVEENQEIVSNKIDELNNVNMSEKTINTSSYDSDVSSTGSVNLVRRRRNRTKRTVFENIGTGFNLHLGDDVSNNVFTTKEILADNNIDVIKARTETLIHEISETRASENSASHSFSAILNPIEIINTTTNEEILSDNNGIFDLRIETLSQEISEEEFSENENLNLNFTIEAEPREIINLDNFDLIFEPIIQEGMDEDANLAFATVEEISNFAPDLIEENYISSQEVYKSKYEVHEKISVKEKLEDYKILFIILLCAICFIIWLAF